jgi:hypothetical protein
VGQLYLSENASYPPAQIVFERADHGIWDAAKPTFSGIRRHASL